LVGRDAELARLHEHMSRAAVGYGYYDIGIILAAADFFALMLRMWSPGRSSTPESGSKSSTRPNH
jgi:hypothetical protein